MVLFDNNDFVTQKMFITRKKALKVYVGLVRYNDLR